MDEGALAVERRIAARDTGLQGHLTVTSLEWLGDSVVAPILTKFGVRHPLVTLELVNDERRYSLSRREADVAFRPGSFEQEDLIERKVADIAYGLYASAGYLDRYGLPDFTAGCPGHTAVTLREGRTPARSPLSQWLKSIAPRTRVALRTNTIHALLSAVDTDEVLAVLPRVLADRRLALRRLETPLPEPVLPLRLGVHADLRETPRVREFIDFAVSELAKRAPELNPV
ncbi:LysR substrate-binding domain-containing protein [Pyxidicoccus sp. QH1ED-7-1]|nr:LysR substrate-binding domain-containing protein [Pyxidicoccus xibeiensis]